jgi:hypothetical protein
MKKFRKVAQKTGFIENLPKINSWSSFMDWIKSNPDDKLMQFFSGNNAKRNLNYLAGLMMGWSNDRYGPKAYEHVMNSKGYGNTEASQGAFEVMSPDISKQLEDFKNNPPKNLTDFVTHQPLESLDNITVPESSDRYKAMEEKLYGKNASSKKFVKTSQNAKAEELKKIVPEWTIENVLNDMAKAANNPRLSNAEKQKSMFDVLNNYERQIAPLSQYLEKNGIKPK